MELMHSMDAMVFMDSMASMEYMEFMESLDSTESVVSVESIEAHSNQRSPPSEAQSPRRQHLSCFYIRELYARHPGRIEH